MRRAGGVIKRRQLFTEVKLCEVRNETLIQGQGSGVAAVPVVDSLRGLKVRPILQFVACARE